MKNIRDEDQKELQKLINQANMILQKYNAVATEQTSTTTISHAINAVANAKKWINLLNLNVDQF